MASRVSRPDTVSVNEAYKFRQGTSGFRLTVEWVTQNRQPIDLDISCLIYDDVARCFEKLSADFPLSSDGSMQLQTDIAKGDNSRHSLSNDENVHIDLRKLSSRVTAMVVFIEGGSRNFNVCEKIYVHCTQENTKELGKKLTLMQQLKSERDRSKVHLFSSMHTCRPQEYEGMVACAMYRHGFVKDSGDVQWVCQPLFDQSYKVTVREKEDHCTKLLLDCVPAFKKFRPRIFSSVKGICSALSSTSLPLLKKSFTQSKGLPLESFTEELFVQLYDSKPQLADHEEASNTVALLHDLFGQIDFNGDGFVDWDEFTTFCIHTGLVSDEGDATTAASSLQNLNQYTIEYTVNHDIIDSTLTSYLPLNLVRHIPESKRLMVLEDSGREMLVFNEDFQHLCTIDPLKLNKNSRDHITQMRVYDICYIPFKDLYAFSSSDHSITIYKEHSSVGGRRLHHTSYNRLFHHYLMMKLCWSERNKLLCSVDSENVVYGWEIDGESPLFQLSRHSELVTDFISVDSHQIFVTCSLDKRIILWSQTSRRVKGVLMGHTRGVRCVSHAKDTLLSAGFECEAKTWDLVTKEPALLLRGHRFPICCAKIMCRSENIEEPDNLRAVTVDDSGEMRLWNIFVKEKTSDLGLAEVLQIFTGVDEAKTAQISFIYFPFNPKYSTDKYSNIVAASSKLHHFTAEKTKKEFISPSCMLFSESNAALLTAVGKNIMKYDVIHGGFHCEFNGLNNGEITAMSWDGLHMRRLYAGMANGEIMMINFSTGQRISELVVHNKEVTSVAAMTYEGKVTVFSCSHDGGIKALTESGGRLTIHYALDNALGENAPLILLKPLQAQNLIMAASANRTWGIWTAFALKRLIFYTEEENISGMELIDMGTGAFRAGELQDYSANIVILAVCLANGVNIYALNHSLNKIVHSHTLVAPELLYLSRSIVSSYPKSLCVNYGATVNPIHLGLEDVLVASSDEGKIMVWNLVGIGMEAVDAFYSLHPDLLNSVEMSLPTRTQEDNAAWKKRKAELRKKIKLSRLMTKDSFKCLNGIDTTNSNKPESLDSTELTNTTELTEEGSMQARRVSSYFSKPSNSVPSSLQKSDRNNRQMVKMVHVSLCWQGHADIIQSMIPLVEHNCFISMSLDGYIRFWNLQEECVGELPLPNITDHRRKYDKEKDVVRPQCWKFVMEKMPVTWEHRSIAARLVQMVQLHSKNARKRSAAQEYYHRRFQQQLHAQRLQRQTSSFEHVGVELDEKSIRRQVIMSDLFAPYAPAEDSRDSIINSSTSGERGGIQEEDMMGTSATSSGVEEQRRDTVTLPDNHLERRPITAGGALERMKLPNKKTVPPALHSHNRSLYRETKPWNNIQSLHANRVAAFSNSSINASHAQGVIDYESRNLLRRVNEDQCRVAVYERTQPTIHLRNVNKACTVQYPGGSTDSAELNFGAQKDMYKNASKIIREQAKSRPSSVTASRHQVAMSRISNNVSSAGNMLHCTEHSIHSDVALPPLPTVKASENGTTGQSLLRIGDLTEGFLITGAAESAPKVSFDKKRVSQLVDKVTEATNDIPDWEMRQDQKYKQMRKTRSQKKIDRYNNAHEVLISLERKLKYAMMSAHQGVDSDTLQVRQNLTTRDLLPYYKILDLKNFLEIFHKVDNDFSGDLNVNEWLQFFYAFNKSITISQARTMFVKLDEDKDGFLSLRDLIPVIFSKANREQLVLITKYLEAEVVTKKEVTKKEYIHKDELETMFAYYDVDLIGFVDVKRIKDKIRSFRMPDQAHLAIFAMFKGYEDDEMLNLAEFLKLFAPYTLTYSVDCREGKEDGN